MIRKIIENISKDYEEWKETKQEIEMRVDSSEKELKKITGNTNGGILSDEIRTSSEYKTVKKKFDAAFNDLRNFNKNSPKDFLKKERSEYRNKRSY